MQGWLQRTVRAKAKLGGSKGGVRGSAEGCKDGSDLYRPIVKAEEPGNQTPQIQVWNTRPIEEFEYNTLRRKGEMTKYRKDSSTELWMAALTEETCKANEGFVCKVRLGITDVISMMMMFVINGVRGGPKS